MSLLSLNGRRSTQDALWGSAEIGVGALVTVWGVATTLHNLPDQKFNYQLAWSKVGLTVPNWRFFGPNPGISDSHLLVRSFDVDGTVSEWSELPLAHHRPPWALLWNPGSRGPKALFDLIQAVMSLSMKSGGRFGSIESSPPYRMLEEHVRLHAEIGSSTASVQFMLLQSTPDRNGERELKPLVVSRNIPVGEPKGTGIRRASDEGAIGA
ncbi:hypothetical protein [Rhodococcus sp. MALMAid1271]|uniref:hypothetical protein n=1 Tax=Rhodococcus sp. MALMAid1271 TaxID=3411744 RepID=UPI003B9F3C0E